MDIKGRILPQMTSGTESPPTRNLGRKLAATAYALVLAGAGLAVLASWSGGSLRAVGDKISIAVDRAVADTGLSVAHIRTPGLNDAKRAAILPESGVRIGDNMFRVNPYRIRHQVAGLAFIGDVQVVRMWPDTIVIVAAPRQAAALMRTGATWAVLDTHGQQIEGEAAADHPNLPHLADAENAGAAGALIATLIAHPELAQKMTLAQRVAGRRWDLLLTSGARLALPSEGWRQRLGAMIDLHARYRLFDLPLVSIDARRKNRIVVVPGQGGQRDQEGRDATLLADRGV